MSRRYHLLLERDDANSPWAVAFGDYERHVVMSEYRDYRDHDVRASNLRVTPVEGDTQADIDRLVAQVNGRAL